MRFHLQFDSGQPVYLQLMEQVKAAAASGALRPGEPLPGIRPLAEQLRVNRNTVARAWLELEREGVIETRQGKGCFLRANGEPRLRKAARTGMLHGPLDAAIVQAHHLQIPDDELLRLLRERLEHFHQAREAHRS
ncbi:MAG TPA: GntR family transcriptional regulator [Verrucomicrobiota bacterium]|nr:GntR family transcriptional regulator [Verrucomicrobiota bacterium]